MYYDTTCYILTIMKRIRSCISR